MTHKAYIGRFAPTPSGPLHFGSVVAALGSCLDAKANGGKWRVRIEDIDEPRTAAGAASSILRTLEKLGMEWDGEVVYQSMRKPLYRDALEKLKDVAYPCSCSRVPGIYKGTCRSGPKGEPRSIRVRVTDETISFVDCVQGEFSQNLEKESGDFVVLRADGFFAYQLAVAVDDFEQNVTHVVRGADLLDSTPRQLYLQKILGAPHPSYSHLPLALNENAEKLSKQNHAKEVVPGISVLVSALEFLGQNPPRELMQGDIESFWDWGKRNWDLKKVPKTSRIAACPKL